MRDWLYVEDHTAALLTVLTQLTSGSTYAISGDNKMRNINIVRSICSILDAHHLDHTHHAKRMRFTPTRSGAP
ncbi:hypothetical protein GLR48_23440 [Loktanella sp. M215]|nr:hypothetical protein [Loktanella sp. M215]